MGLKLSDFDSGFTFIKKGNDSIEYIFEPATHKSTLKGYLNRRRNGELEIYTDCMVYQYDSTLKFESTMCGNLVTIKVKLSEYEKIS